MRWAVLHPGVTKLATAGIAVVLLAAGLVAGAHTPAPAAQENSDTQQLVAHVQASRHSVIGVVRGIGPNGFLVRNAGGVVFAVRTGSDSRFRAGGREIRPAALRVGDRVLVLGSPASDGTLHATVTTIVARPGGRLPSSQSSSAAPGAPEPPQ